MISFMDLKAQHRPLEEELIEAVSKVIKSCGFVLGPEVAAFESEFAAFSKAAHCVALNTGTSALHLALLAAGIGPGDEVITVTHTFVATVSAIRYSGATPVLVDIDPVSFTMDPALIEKAITPKTKAIIPVHLYGQMADMDPIVAIAKKHNLVLIEDACQAHGAEYKGRRAGSIGDIAAFSFYPGKNLGACGEGGGATSNSAAHDKTMRMLRDWGQDRKYNHLLEGYNYRMDGMQGACLRVKLRHLEAWTEGRRRVADRYREALGNDERFRLPAEVEGRRHVWHIYALRVADRDTFMKWMLERGIQTGIHYPTPVHLQPAFKVLGYEKGAFPHSEKAADEVVSLPMFPELTPEDQDKVIAALKEAPGVV
jgi:dTDP-4-amino-4,6-dideoxygalactose transaminase